ncbi:MIF4G domain-containing protein A [Galendromus occidentalis]|uniref:MIF4G domain-containing protein A n=1 Tax=Galendromus occidentalis TaxID=34638 RepID=A0AAJ6QRN3_9ACAR|nr:MIF4G domain-containing protein A [Galendromus occidentalis]
MHGSVSGGGGGGNESGKIRRSATAANASKMQQRGRPSIEIYRPPGVREEPLNNTKSVPQAASFTQSYVDAMTAYLADQASGAGAEVAAQLHARSHFSTGAVSVGTHNGGGTTIGVGVKSVHFSPSKSSNSLKRSKSFAAQTNQGSGHGHSHHTQQQQVLSQAIQAQDENGHSSAALNDPLVKKALSDPNMLTLMQIMEVVRSICGKATEGIQHAGPSAQLCLSIIEKENGVTFLESLLNSCREWYNDRDKLLRSPQEGSAIPKRWTAYVTFVAELYYRLRPQRLITPRAVTLCTLLYDCLELLLKPTSLKNPTELECLRTVLSVVGKQIDADAPQRMNNLVNHMRDSFLGTISANNQQMRKSILELIELRASSWQFDLQQSMYYFPYTK